MNNNITAAKGRPIFYAFSFLVLFTTAIAKLLSLANQSPILFQTDSLLGIKYKYLFIIMGMWELIVCAIILFRFKGIYKLWALWITSCGIMLYRITKTFYGLSDTCPCLGNMTGSLGLKNQTLDSILYGIGAFLFIGSFYYVMINPYETENAHN